MRLPQPGPVLASGPVMRQKEDSGRDYANSDPQRFVHAGLLKLFHLTR
jgi:hypothetical protein